MTATGPPLVAAKDLLLGVPVEQHLAEVDGLDPVDQRLVGLGQHGHPALGKAFDDPTIKARFVELGSTAPMGAERGPAGLQKLVESEVARITPVLKAAAAKAAEAEKAAGGEKKN